MLDHKHLIIKGQLDQVLTVEDVTNLINELVQALGMKYVETMPINPVVGYEPNEYPGVSGVGIITTSHIAIHTWDKTMQYQLDIYSCKTFTKDTVHAVTKKYGLNEESIRIFDRNYDIIDIY